jgi:spermidine synthase
MLAVRPRDFNDPQRAAFSLTHGRVLHGFQLRAPAERRTPTAYYATDSGVGRAILGSASGSAARHRQLRIGVVGLGVGTIAAYGQPGDTIRFYEINPEVLRIASDSRYFTYLSDRPANVEVILGDARLAMEREVERNERQDYDVLVIDAFSGDAIPVHLLTLEAFEIYLSQLRKPSGILAIHVTNSYLDLRPIVLAAAEHFGLETASVHSSGDGRATESADWMLLSLDSKILESVTAGSATGEQNRRSHAIRPWTDDYSNLLQILSR